MTMSTEDSGNANGYKTPGGSDDESHHDDEGETSRRQRELAITRQEKELAERELALARQQIEMLRRNQSGYLPNNQQALQHASNDGQSTSAPSIQAPPIQAHTTKVNVNLIADLLNYFNGNSETFGTWEKQVKFLRTAYKLEDDLTKIMIGTRLNTISTKRHCPEYVKGRALEWFHSKPEYIRMTSDDPLNELRGLLYHRPNKIALRRRFEERVWKKDETFHDYVHQKTVMANRIAIPDDGILGYIVDGIPDPNLHDVFRLVTGSVSVFHLVFLLLWCKPFYRRFNRF